MCGINGIFAFGDGSSPVSRSELIATRDHMLRRGPDGCGEWINPSGRIGFGHRRLSIQDLSERGAQPMHSVDGTLTVTFNGEIYNYPALRKELEHDGVQFRSTSDTEVLIHLYLRYGERMVDRLRGMFAFGLWDARQRRLLMARDPFGIKPLYIHDAGHTVRFASQVKALLAGGSIDTDADAAGLVGFFVLGAVPEPHTLYRQIKPLPAGSTLTIDENGRRYARQYFDIRQVFVSAQHVAPAEVVDTESAQAAIRESVHAHLLSDVPVGVFLSAGIDSGAIAGIAAEHGGPRLHAATLGFAEYRGTANDEMPLAKAVAAHYGVAHHGEWVTRDDFEDLLTDLKTVMDQPSIDGLNTYLVSGVAARHGIKVALSGVGGDELFGGYPSFRRAPRIARALSWMRHFRRGGVLTRQLLRRIPAALPNPKMAGLLEYGGTIGGAYLLQRSLFMPFELDRLLDPRTLSDGWAELNLPDAMDDCAKGVAEDRAKVSALELGWYMRNQLLRDADWAGMAHSLEVRLPLVDSQLFTTLATSIAGTSPLDKVVLANAPHRPLPPDVASRPKTGFSTPLRSWIGSGQGDLQQGLRGWARTLAPTV